MVKYFLHALKIAILATIVLLIGQIPVGQKRICDHVHDATLSTWVQKPVHWIAEKFDFADHNLIAKQKDGDNEKDDREGKRVSLSKHRSAHAAKSEHVESERVRLSGLLKH